MDKQQWIKLCTEEQLLDNAGVAALVGERQLALFYVPANDAVYAVDNFDPVMEAQVMARGLVGSQGEQHYVASPLLKQRYCLATGQGLDDAKVSLGSWPVRRVGGAIEVAMSEADKSFSYA